MIALAWHCFAGLAMIPLVALLVAPAAALEVEFATRPVKRDVLALYDSRHEPHPDESRLHRLAEMPLNWLGYQLTYVDINKDLPSPEQAAGYRGVVTWFIEPMHDPARYLAWLDGVTAAGLRYICLGEPAPPEPLTQSDRVDHILARLGLKPRDQFVSVTLKATVATSDAQMIGFERPLDKVLPEFRVIEASSPAAKVHLSATVPDQEGGATAVLVATSAAGGYAADSYTIFYDATADKARWVLNPFAFFEAALGDERFPVPDVTTRDGRRMYFSHIDGDGWNNVSEIEGYRETKTSAAEVILHDIIEPYPDLPVSVGLIAGDAIAELGGSASAKKSSAKLYALPQVEVASHTYSHPFTWSFFKDYDRNAELAMIDKAAHPDVSAMDFVRSLLYRVAGKADVSETHNRFVAGSADLPRSYMKEPFDMEREVRRALETSESLAPPGKKAAIYLWSGDTEPFEAAVKATRAAGVRNMNGGDSRFDAEFPSVFYVPPIARPVGGERQIYAANSNENTYTNNWHGPYYGQMMLKETLDKTERPRRLKPFNLYYHMFSGEKSASLAAIKTYVDLARSADVIPVKASEYAGIADDFFEAEIKQLDATSWTVARRGMLQTVRFDHADGLDIDLLKSVGVLGAARHQGSLYVALDENVESALVVIRPLDEEQSESSSKQVRLIESRWHVQGLKREACDFSFDAHGFGAGDMVWQAAPAQAFDVHVTRNGIEQFTGKAAADATGLIKIRIEADALDPVEIRMACDGR